MRIKTLWQTRAMSVMDYRCSARWRHRTPAGDPDLRIWATVHLSTGPRRVTDDSVRPYVEFGVLSRANRAGPQGVASQIGAAGLARRRTAARRLFANQQPGFRTGVDLERRRRADAI